MTFGVNSPIQYLRMMIRNRILTTGILLCAINSIAQEEVPATMTFKEPSGRVLEFRLAFNDEFDGSALDLSKWKATEGIVRDAELVNSQNWFSRSNVEVSEGTLKLWIKRDTLLNRPYEVWIRDGMKPFQNDFYFTSAEINSRAAYQYGLYEIRCRLPKGKGLVPAFWMYGEYDGVNHELDVFEFWNEKGVLRSYRPDLQCRVHHMTLHHKGRMSGKSFKADNDHSEDFHTYTLIWDNCRIIWLVDEEIRRIQYRYTGMNRKRDNCIEFASSKKVLNENVFPNAPVEILAGVAVQTGKKQPDATNPFPVALEVDYIRYYEWAK